MKQFQNKISNEKIIKILKTVNDRNLTPIMDINRQ